MQQPISRRDVYAPSLSARIGGRDVELVSASVDRSLPDPVVGGTLTAASGSLVAVEGEDVARTVATPWDPGSVWPPVPQSPASVSMDTGAGPVSLLANGVVMSASGGTSGREVDVEVSDAYESLNRTISWDAVSALMPPLEWDWNRRRHVSMNSIAVTDKILRHCGWYSTPPTLQWNALSVPGNGTMWPERGQCLHAGRRSAQHLVGFPGWLMTPWGIGVTDFQGEYRLGGDHTIKARGRVELTAMTTAPESGWSWIAVEGTSGNGLVRLMWSAGAVVVQVRDPSGAYAEAARVTRSDGFAYATVEYVSDTTVHATVRSGASSSSAVVSVESRVTTERCDTAEIISLGPSSGFQVAFPSSAGALAGWEPNAIIRPRPAARNYLEVLPSVEGENCADLLAAQCEAEAATYWIDETGVLQWWDLGRLEARGNVATLNSDDDIEESGFTWSHSLSSVKSRASVKWREPLRELTAAFGVTLWQGSGKTMQAGDENVEEWLNVPDDEVWIMPDLFMDKLGLSSMTDFNYGHGSAFGAVIAGSGEDTDRWADQAQGTIWASLERVTDRAFKLVTSWTGTLPVVMRTPSEASTSTLWRVRRNFDLPILRGKAKFMFTDRVAYSSQTGPATSPEHTVDAGWWIQHEAQAQYTANYYGARTTVPQPVLSSVALIPVPGLQIGDMVTVTDEHVTRLTIRGLIIEDSRSINADMDMQHAVAIRPISVTLNGATWAQWAQVARPDTWATWATRQAGSWQQWGIDPLGKEI